MPVGPTRRTLQSTMPRPFQLSGVLAAALLLVASHPCHAQQALREVTIVAPAAPGGGWDQTARVMQQVIRETGLAGTVQVVNTPGAAGTIGLARFVNSERGNGNALLVTGLVMVSGIVTNHSPVTLADATPIARLSGEYEVVVVPASSPFKTLGELIAAFKASPRAVSWGGGSAGGTDEILVRLIAGKVGVPTAGVNYIAYSGGGQALAAVLGAHVSAAVSGLGEFGAQIESGDLRALAISSPERVPGVAIPTFREQGMDVALMNWRGVMAPPGLKRAERNALADLTRRMATSDAWKAALARSGWADIYMEGDKFGRFINDETARVGPLVASAERKRGVDWFEWFVLAGFALALVAAIVERAKANRRSAASSANPVPPAHGAADDPMTASAKKAANVLAVATLALALVLDAALINWTGFIIASAGMFILTARAFGSRRVVRDVLIAFALAAVVQIAFTRGLGVSLPAGALFS